MISSLIKQVDQARMSRHLFYLSKDPLPCRTLNVTLPGHTQNTLYEADDFITEQLTCWGYSVQREAVPVQAFRPDTSKPMPHQFARPEPSDPWYQAYNLYAKKGGKTHPKEVLVVVSHKDSQSWILHAPGANDNATGTVGTMEMARLLRDYDAQRSIWFLFCNEEHRPWTSEVAARNLAESDLKGIAVLNLDGIGGKSQADRAAGRMVNVTRYTTPEGEILADLMAEINQKYQIGLIQKKFRCEQPNDDDGSFVKAGIPAAILNIGSFPYAEPHYHRADDRPEHVDLRNVRMATQLSLAAVVHLDRYGLVLQK